jgi:predicted nucleic acid-binding protein
LDRQRLSSHLVREIGHLALLGELADEICVPDAVVCEVGAKSEGDHGRFVSLSGARVEADVPVSSDVAAWSLGRGESQVITLAGVIPGSRTVLDDLAARRCAQSLGLPVIGTLGIVLRAKRKGVITAARPIVEHLRRVGLYASDALIEQALAHLGE